MIYKNGWRVLEVPSPVREEQKHMELQVGESYVVDQGWIECLYGPTLSHGDKIEVLFVLKDRVNAVRVKGEEKEIVIFSLKEVHEGSLLEHTMERLKQEGHDGEEIHKAVQSLINEAKEAKPTTNEEMFED